MAHQRRPALVDRDLDVFTAILRDDAPGIGRLDDGDPGEFCLAATDHGILPLVADRLASRPHVPAHLAAALRAQAAGMAACSLVQDAEVARVCVAFEGSGIPAVLIKGAHLASAVYPRPDLRPRLDSDLLVRPADRDRAVVALEALGYVPVGQVAGELVSSQMTLTVTTGGMRHAIDLHWRVANPQAAALCLSADELIASSVPVPALGSAARGLSPVHALVLACVHRVAHHYDSDRLIWLYDVHLLARELDDETWREVVRLAAHRGVGRECRLGLSGAAERFGTPVPAWVWDAPTMSAVAAERLAATYVRHRPRHLRGVASDLATLRTWRDRWTLVREHAFPSATYMRTVYAPRSAAPLAVLYATRVVRGAGKWLREVVDA